MASTDPHQYALNTLLEGIPHEQYLRLEGINASGLKEVVRSPAHYKAMADGEVGDNDTPAKALGRAAHMAILEPERFKAGIKPRPSVDRRSAEGKAEHAEAEELARDQGVELISRADYDACCRMRDKVHSVPFLANLLSKGQREATLLYHDETFDLPCKVRPDFISAKSIVVDLKTTLDARAKPFARDIEKYMYHLQAAHYLAGGEASGLWRADAFVFLAIEKRPPYEIGIYVAGPATLNVGKQWRDYAMELYAEARRTNEWPGYPRKALTIEVPQWASVPEDVAKL